jgi:hypothetical protein
VKLVPGARVVVQNPEFASNPSAFVRDVLVRDLRSKKRHFILHGTEALVIGVDFISKDRGFANVSIFVAEHGFFLTTTNWITVLWSPVQNDGDVG